VIRNASKGVGALYNAKDLFLAAAEAGSQPQKTTEDEESIIAPAPPKESDHQQGFLNATDEWLAPITPSEPLGRRRRSNISQNPRYKTKTSTQGDEECIAAPDHILDWIFRKEAQDALYKAGHGTAPDLIYAIGISDTPIPDPCAFDRKRCNLVLIEFGF
jgi:hypothetical protein